MNILFGVCADDILNEVITITAKQYLKSGNTLVLNLAKDVAPTEDLKEFIFENDINLMVHNSAKNVLAQYETDWRAVRPLDQQTIYSMRECEAVTLKMMDRLERDYSSLAYENRKMQYLKHLRYWNHLLLDAEINLAVFFEIPHEVYDYVLYCLCKYYNIPTVVFHQTCMPAYSVISDCWEQQSPELDEHYARLIADYRVQGLTEDCSEYRGILYNGYHQHFERRVPFYMGTNAGKSRIGRFFRKGPRHFIKAVPQYLHWLCSDRHGNFSSQRVINVFKFMLKNYRLNKTYESLAVNPVSEEKFIYFALHAQPERSTSPQAGVFVDQLLAIQMLDFVLPRGWKIYVKDHPVQTAVGREISFYRELAEIPSVKIIKKDVDSHELVRNSAAVATCNGNVGLEAVLDNKPVITFGYVYYQCCAGVFTARSEQECREIIETINKGYSVDPNEVTLFFKALYETSVRSSLDANFHKQTEFLPQECIYEISRHLLRKISQLAGEDAGVADQQVGRAGLIC